MFTRLASGPINVRFGQKLMRSKQKDRVAAAYPKFIFVQSRSECCCFRLPAPAKEAQYTGTAGEQWECGGKWSGSWHGVNSAKQGGNAGGSAILQKRCITVAAVMSFDTLLSKFFDKQNL